MQEEMRRRTREAPAGSLQVKIMNERETDIEARKGKPGHGTRQESKRLRWPPETGQVVFYRMPPGCLIRHSTQIMGKP